MVTLLLDTDTGKVDIEGRGTQVKVRCALHNIDSLIALLDIAGDRKYDMHGIIIWQFSDPSRVNAAIASNI
jgi:hypothetical protein